MDAPVPHYDEVIAALIARGIITRFQKPTQLIVSNQIGPVWPTPGNSFWITRANNEWHLCTWGPTAYFVPTPSDIIPLCIDFMAVGDRAAFDVPQGIVDRYRLRELGNDEL